MFSLRPVFKASLLALLVFLVFLSSSVVVVAQQQQDAENATTPLRPSNNDQNTTDSSSLLMTNYNALREEGQGFYLAQGIVVYEKPGTKTAGGPGLYWWCDFEFSSEDNATNNYGYVGRGVQYLLGSTLDDVRAQGGSFIPSSDKFPVSVSAVLVPTLGLFEGQFHATHDVWVNRFWDAGTSTLPILGWEGHDEGDTHPKADTSAWSSSGTFTKISREAAAKYLGMDVTDLTPATCRREYEATWNATHVPDPIDTSVTTLEENVAQLKANNKELLSRIVAIEGSLPATGSGSDRVEDGEAPATSASSPFMAWYEHTSMDVGMQSIMTVAVIIGLIAVDFI